MRKQEAMHVRETFIFNKGNASTKTKAHLSVVVEANAAEDIVGAG